MANAPETPSSPIDVRKLLGDLDPTKMMNEMQALLKQYKLPGIDLDSLVASQKKNIEAVTAANRAAVEGVQALAKRQAEVMQETMREAAQAISGMTKVGSPGELVAKQADFARSAFEKGVATMQELAEIVTKSNKQVTATINARVTATLEEIRSLALKK